MYASIYYESKNYIMFKWYTSICDIVIGAFIIIYLVNIEVVYIRGDVTKADITSSVKNS